MLRRLVLALVAIACVGAFHASPASAQDGASGRLDGESERLRDRDRRGGDRRGGREGGRSRPRFIPELDPATAGAIAALVVGGGVLLARRRKS